MKESLQKKVLLKQTILEKNQNRKKSIQEQKKILQLEEEKSKEPTSTPPKKRGRPHKQKEVVVVDPKQNISEKKLRNTKKASKKVVSAPKVKKPRKSTEKKKIKEDNPSDFQVEQGEKQQVIKTIDGCYQTPILPVKYSSVKKPYKFANNDVPRYSITLILDEKKNKSFISKLEQLRTKEGAENFRKEVAYVNDRGFKIHTGNSLIKFQGKDKIAIFDKEGSELELTDEIPEQTKVSVVFEVRCYLNKRTNQNAFNLHPRQVFIHEIPTEGKKEED